MTDRGDRIRTCDLVLPKHWAVFLRKVLSGELALMFCFLAVALFNTFYAGIIVDGGPPPPFWIVLIANPLLCIYGLIKNKN